MDADSNIWILNDGGNSPEIYQVDGSGTILRKIYIKNAPNTDWESLTTDRNGRFFIGDFGNNDNRRQDLKILIIPDPTLITGDSVDAEIIAFSYEDQTSFPPPADSMNYDAEAFIHLHNKLYIFTKDRTSPFAGYSFVYELPDSAGTYTAVKIDSIFIGGTTPELSQVTDATINYNNDEIMLCGYQNLWYLTDFAGINFSSGTLQTMETGSLTQKEALYFVNNDSLIMSDEYYMSIGRNLYGVKIIQPSGVTKFETALRIFPNPTFNEVTIEGIEDIEMINIYTMNGQLVYSGLPLNKIDFLKHGQYIFEIIAVDAFKQVVIKL